MKTVLLVVLAVGLIMAPAGQAIIQPLTTAQADAEEAAARALMERVIAAKPEKAPPPELFTNRTAARIGVDVYLALGMIEQVESRQKDVDRGQLRQLETRIAEFGKAYGLKNGTTAQPNMPNLEAHGRQFYQATLGLLAGAWAKAPAGLSFNIDPLPLQLPRDIGSYKFFAGSAKQVKIMVKKHYPIAARWEDGQWRLDLGEAGDQGSAVSHLPPAGG